MNSNNRVQNNPRLTSKGYPSIEEIMKLQSKELEPPKESKPYNEIGLSLDLSCDRVYSADHRVKVNMLPKGPVQFPIQKAKVDIFAYKPCNLHELIQIDVIKLPFEKGDGHVNVKMSTYFIKDLEKIKVELFPIPELHVTCIVPSSSVGWDGVPRRPIGNLRPRRGLPYSRLERDPIDADGVPVRDHRRVPSPTWSGRKNSRKQGWARGIHENNTFSLVELHMFAPVKVQFLMSDHTRSYYKAEVDAPPKTRKLGDVGTTILKFIFQPPCKFIANGAFGPWGFDHITVSLHEKKDKKNCSCPSKCIEDLYIFPLEDIYNWWVTAKYPHGNHTRRKIRDMILSKLPIAKLFAMCWMIPKWKQRLLGASKNYLIKDYLKHNKEYCPTLFDARGDTSFYAFHTKHRIWINFPSFDFLPINIMGMLGGDGGLLLLYGNDKPKEVIQRGKRTLHIPPWQTLKRPYDSQFYPTQHILMVCNPITRAYRFLPPFTMFLQSLTTRMMVSNCGGFYSIYLMGWNFTKESELHVAIYNSLDKCWIEHKKTFKGCEVKSTMGYTKALPYIMNGPDGGLAIYNVCQIIFNPKKPLEYKFCVIAYSMNSLTWIVHIWDQEQPLPPSVPSDPPLYRTDPPSLVECNNYLFGVARSFLGTKAFIQVFKFVPPTSIPNDVPPPKSNAPPLLPKFVTYGPPMLSKLFHQGFPRNLYPYEEPLELNCVSGMGNIWIAPPNSSFIIFFNVKIMEWSNIASIKIDQHDHNIKIGSWTFQPSMHAMV